VSLAPEGCWVSDIVGESRKVRAQIGELSVCVALFYHLRLAGLSSRNSEFAHLPANVETDEYEGKREAARARTGPRSQQDGAWLLPSQTSRQADGRYDSPTQLRHTRQSS